MKLVIDENGSRKESEALFKYLMEYMNDASNSLRAKSCHIMAEALEKQTSVLRTEYFKLLQENKFIKGWK